MRKEQNRDFSTRKSSMLRFSRLRSRRKSRKETKCEVPQWFCCDVDRGLSHLKEFYCILNFLSPFVEKNKAMLQWGAAAGKSVMQATHGTSSISRHLRRPLFQTAELMFVSNHIFRIMSIIENWKIIEREKKSVRHWMSYDARICITSTFSAHDYTNVNSGSGLPF